MGGVFPSAPDVATYWQNILDCKDSRVEVTAERWVDDPDWFVDREDADRVSNLKVCLAESIPEPRAGAYGPAQPDVSGGGRNGVGRCYQ